VLGLEVPDVLAQRLGQVPLALAGLDVLPLEPLHVVLVERGRHRLHRLEEVADGLEVLVPVEHTGLYGRGVGVVRDRVPGAEHDVIQGRQRHEVADQGRAPLGPLAQTDGAHLGERADRTGRAAAHVLDARDERGRDGTEAHAEHAELPFRRRDPPSHLFSHC
jgi:hypothetical protein